MRFTAFLIATIFTAPILAWEPDTSRPVGTDTQFFIDHDGDGVVDIVAPCKVSLEQAGLCTIPSILIVYGAWEAEPEPLQAYCGNPINFVFRHNVDWETEDLPSAYVLEVDGIDTYTYPWDDYRLNCGTSTCTISDPEFVADGTDQPWRVRANPGPWSESRPFNCP